MSPQAEIDRVIGFIRETFSSQGFDQAVIAVSGGIDSAAALTLLAQALSPKQITTIFLPFNGQSTADAELACSFNHISQENQLTIDITQGVTALAEELGLVPIKSVLNSGGVDVMRLGNVMARCRMTAVFDTAKRLEALVCGTENKSERLLGYYTRYGDGASDLEPIVHLYKTEVRQLARELGIPDRLINKDPSAGLWPGQTDRKELGFTYEQADRVLQAMEAGQTLNQLTLRPDIVQAVEQRVKQNSFKQQVPYQLPADY